MIYFTQDRGNNNIKIGFSADNVEGRRRALQTGNSSRLEVLLVIDGTKQDEDDLHKRFSEANVNGEWFLPVPELIRFIIQEVQTQAAKICHRSEFGCDSSVPPTWIHDFVANIHEEGELHDQQIGPGHEMRCPVCKEEYVHLVPGETSHALRAKYGASKSLLFHGECGHTFSVCFHFHKGFTYVAAIREPDETKLFDPANGFLELEQR